jgi:outer membrane protein assembly factor BamB
VPALVQRRGYFVLAMNPDADVVRGLREAASADGLLGSDVIVVQGTPADIPLADNYANVVVVDAAEGLERAAAKETMRVLVPNGEAVIWTPEEDGQLAYRDVVDLLDRAGRSAAVASGEAGASFKVRKGALEGAAGWSHWHHGPDNNPVSADSALRWPLATQWMGRPFFAQRRAFYLAAGGRVFSCTRPTPGWIVQLDSPGLVNAGDTLIARDGYNGRVLWSRPLEPSALLMHMVWIATPDRFYMTDGPELLALSAATGAEADRLALGPENTQIKWMALQDGRLYALLGEPEPEGYPMHLRADEPTPGMGHTLCAWDLENREKLWEHATPGSVDGRAVALSDGRLFYLAPGRAVGALQAESGEELWTVKDAEVVQLLDAPHTPGKLDGITGFRNGIVATPHAMAVNLNSHKHRMVFEAQTGRLLWKNELRSGNHGRGGHMMILDGMLLSKGMRPTVCDLESGQAAEEGPNLNFSGGCGRFTASQNLLVGMLGGVYDRQEGVYRRAGYAKPDCHTGSFVADGLLYNPPGSCKCGLPFRGFVVRGSAPHEDVYGADPAPAAQVVGEAPHGTVTDADWSELRGGPSHSAATAVTVGTDAAPELLWQSEPLAAVELTPPVTAGNRTFVAGDDGAVRAYEADGTPAWAAYTEGPILSSPTLAGGMVYAGSLDGAVYAFAADDGRLVWRYRPWERDRRIMVYGRLSSRRPFAGGVVVHDDAVYAAAGLVDADGFMVFALDARTGELKWHTEDLGALAPGGGFVPTGRLVVARGRLWVRTHNAMPCSFDLATGERAPAPEHLTNRDGTPNLTGRGSTGSTRGGDMALFAGRFLVQGGRRFWSRPWEWNTGKKTSVTFLELNENGLGRYPVVAPLPDQAILPAADDGLMLVLEPQFRAPWQVSAWDAARTEEWLASLREKFSGPAMKGLRLGRIVDQRTLTGEPPLKWAQPVPLHARAWALAPDAVLVAGGVEWNKQERAFGAHHLVALSRDGGKELWSVELPGKPAYDGLAVDRSGRILLTLTRGPSGAHLVCIGR